MLDTASTPVTTTYRKNYLAPEYLIDTIELIIELDELQTRVTNRMRVRANPNVENENRKLFLDTDSIEAESICLDGALLDETQYQRQSNGVMLSNLPAECELIIETHIKPQENTSLMGLYKSSGNFCTQCEAQGFRKITLFPDRPDILSVYTVTIVADKEKYPVLLSNGNLIDKGEYKEGNHWVKWHDPFPKPCYLFALVAGNLAMISDTYLTSSGRSVRLEIYSEAHNIEQCDFSLEALKKSMRWDEQVYGREYDLDIYMIVAVDDFNMGAMENKGLNIFNTKYVLARSDTATDADFLGVESVIAHEYFHNWSGNRVTCRDWFQLSLKEGFTVFRDQEFSSDMHSPGVNRIADVNILRSHQYSEDAGPMAHSVLPESYQEINNFYTLTIYNKGAELVRMIRTIVGVNGFRKGSDMYFDSYDGQAVTIEDFIKAMEDANSVDLIQFRRWYTQAGTPVLKVIEDYNKQSQQYRLTVSQSCPDTPGQTQKQAFHIPLVMGLLDSQANEITLSSNNQQINIQANRHSAVLHLKQSQQSFVFENIPDKPVCSFLRGFSAPVKLEMEQSPASLSFLMSNDKDAFNRWDSGQRLMLQVLLDLIADVQATNVLLLNDAVADSIEQILSADIIDPALTALILTPPSELYIAEQMTEIDPAAIHTARDFLILQLAIRFKDQWLSLYHSLVDKSEYVFEKDAVGQRSLRAVCLDYLMSLDDKSVWSYATAQYKTATNMSARLAAFSAILNSSSPEREAEIEDFYHNFKQHTLVMDKWLAAQATMTRPNTLDKVKMLVDHPVFDKKNPNKIRSLIGAFASQNPVCFHAADGSGYDFLANWLIELDTVNPQIAARLAGAFNSWRRYDGERRKLMKQQLKRILKVNNLSRNVKEIVSKALN